MNFSEWFQIAVYSAVLLAGAVILGRMMAGIFQNEKTFLTSVLRPVEVLCHRLSGVREEDEMTWKRYAASLIIFNLLGFLTVFLLQRLQGILPLNPQGWGAVEPWLAFNTAVSFMTNTNWQAYSGEALLGYLTQMLGLGVQNFLSAATGMGVLLVLIRGLVRKNENTVGNFWVDLTKTTVYVLLPLCFVWALLLAGQGVVQNFSPYVKAVTLEGREQLLPMGPAASQIAIKQLGTNGGGFFGVNSAHPFENPTPFSNFLQMLAILLIPAAQVVMFGIMIKRPSEGRVLFGAMVILLAAGFFTAWRAEALYSPVPGVSSAMEGKETRFGVMNSVLWAAATTAASNGSVNAMHDSLTPIAGFAALFNMLLGEIVFGGVGAGLYGMLMMAILTVFIAGLMVGRTPEYIGKKIEAKEMALAAAAILIPSAVVLLGTALACTHPAGLSSVTNRGPHGLSQILYAFASASNNNGSAFAGLGVNTVFYNALLGAAMLAGRFAVILPVLAVGGSLARKKVMPYSAGTFPTDGGLFCVLLIGVILIVGALTFFPVLGLGPILEQGLLLEGRTF